MGIYSTTSEKEESRYNKIIVFIIFPKPYLPKLGIES